MGHAILFMDNAHCYFMKYGVGHGTNNHVEFLALWILLKVATKKKERSIIVLGDFKLLMEWENERNQMRNMALAPIMGQGFTFMGQLEEITLTRIYRL